MRTGRAPDPNADVHSESRPGLDARGHQCTGRPGLWDFLRPALARRMFVSVRLPCPVALCRCVRVSGRPVSGGPVPAQCPRGSPTPRPLEACTTRLGVRAVLVVVCMSSCGGFRRTRWSQRNGRTMQGCRGGPGLADTFASESRANTGLGPGAMRRSLTSREDSAAGAVHCARSRSSQEFRENPESEVRQKCQSPHATSPVRQRKNLNPNKVVAPVSAVAGGVRCAGTCRARCHGQSQGLETNPPRT